MTDKETIKALEYCTNESDGECKECEYDKYYPRCVPKLLEDALDIINRQKAEIERLNNNISAMAVTLRNSAKATRNEAIKEFAERLKKRQVRICDCFEGVSIVDIDKLAKETEG